MTMFTKELQRGDHVKGFFIQNEGTDGWSVREEQDGAVLTEKHLQDWHRVERAVAVFNLRIGELTGRGWRPRGE